MTAAVSAGCQSAWSYFAHCCVSGVSCYSVDMSTTGYYALCKQILLFLLLICEGVMNMCYIMLYCFSSLYLILYFLRKTRIFCMEVISLISLFFFFNLIFRSMFSLPAGAF